MAELAIVAADSHWLMTRAARSMVTLRASCADSRALIAECARRCGPRQPALTQNDALWKFLESHRGKMFCTLCIATSRFATKRIDRAVLGAEGRGARRQYGTRAACGKERLLCGLTS